MERKLQKIQNGFKNMMPLVDLKKHKQLLQPAGHKSSMVLIEAVICAVGLAIDIVEFFMIRH